MADVIRTGNDLCLTEADLLKKGVDGLLFPSANNSLQNLTRQYFTVGAAKPPYAGLTARLL